MESERRLQLVGKAKWYIYTKRKVQCRAQEHKMCLLFQGHFLCNEISR